MQNVRITSGIEYGNLTGLIGTWQGGNGFNMIAVPDQKGEFTLLVAPYTETLIVNALPATTPNRGLQTISNLPTLRYSTTIIDLEDNILMHAENGFWELVDEIPQNMGFDIFRLASIPHGDSLEAMGNSSAYDGPPVIDTTLSGLPVGDLPALDGRTDAGYTDPYLFPVKYPDFFPTSPNQTLVNYLEQQKEKHGLTVTKTVELKVSTQNNGGINNIASLTTNANATQFDATFWLETLTDSSGNITQQLQYSQRIMIAFPIKTSYSGQTIIWPHINVNTLTLNA
jgi:hypothetical protein